MRLFMIGLGGVVALLAQGGAAQAEGGALDGAITTLTGILNESDPNECLPSGGIILLGVKSDDPGMKGWTRLRDDNPVRIQQRDATAEVNKRSEVLAPVRKQAEDADRTIADLEKESSSLSNRMKENQSELDEAKKPPANESDAARDARSQRIATLQQKLAENQAKLSQAQQTIAQTERELEPVRRQQAELEQSVKAARVAENAAWVAADAAGNACP